MRNPYPLYLRAHDLKRDKHLQRPALPIAPGWRPTPVLERRT